MVDDNSTRSHVTAWFVALNSFVPQMAYGTAPNTPHLVTVPVLTCALGLQVLWSVNTIVNLKDFLHGVHVLENAGCKYNYSERSNHIDTGVHHTVKVYSLRLVAACVVVLEGVLIGGRFPSLGASAEYEALSIRGEDAVVRCRAETEPGVRYRSVIWYKVKEAPTRTLTGLVLKKLTEENNVTTQRYKGFMREAELLEGSHSLLLPSVTSEDAGRYLCFLSAPLGHQNQEREIDLRVFERPNEDTRSYEEYDMLYIVLAIALLIAGMLMFYVSYVCLRQALTSNKSAAKNVQRKAAQQMKHLMVSLESKGVVSKALPHFEYV